MRRYGTGMTPRRFRTTVPVRMSDEESASFGAALKAFRLAAGLTQDALAERACISTEAVSALERGFRRRPHAETVSLIASALGLDDERRGVLERAAAQPATTFQPAGNGVPSYSNRLIGRDSEVAEVLRAVRPGSLISIVGPGGVGKSRVAAELARGIIEALPLDTVAFVDLVALHRTDPVPAKLAAALGITSSAGRKTIDALVAFCRARRTALVLDNCEHVADAVATTLAALLKACPELTVIATSRQPIGLSAEVVHRLPPLAVPPESFQPPTAEHALRNPAIALFCERAAQAGRSLVLDSAEIAMVVQICRRLDGMPLAIELAAARLRTMGLSDLRRRLNEQFAILTTPARDVLPRHRTLQATLDWSYELLTERERTFLCAAGVFPDGFTLDAAQTVCSDSQNELETLEVLTALVDKSLIQPNFTGEETRYRMLETMRAYSLERLDASGGRNERMGRLLHYLDVKLASDLRQARDGSEVRLLSSLRTELPSFTAALRWGLAGSEMMTAGELLAKIGVRWSYIERTVEGITWAEAFDRKLPEDAARLRARISASLAHLYGNGGRDEHALQAAERAVTSARQAGDETILFMALRALAMSLARLQRHGEAAAALSEVEAIAGTDPPAWMRRAVLNGRGILAAMRGDSGAAVEAFRANVALARDAGNTYEELRDTLFLSEAAHSAGDTARAASDVEDVLRRGKDVLGGEAVAGLLANLAGYRLALGNVAAGAAAARAAMAAATQPPGFDILFAAAVQQLALAFGLEGDPPTAARLLGYSVATQDALGFERSYTEAQSYDRLLAILRETMPTQCLQEHLAAGARLTAQDVLQAAGGKRDGGASGG